MGDRTIGPFLVPRSIRACRRATTAAAVVFLILVVLLVGGVGYFGLSAATPKSTPGSEVTTVPPPTCSPPTAVYCTAPSSRPNDVTLTVPVQAGYGRTVASVTEGTTVLAELAVSRGEPVNTWAVTWGDGSYTASGTHTLAHAFTGLGTYVLSGHAVVGVVEHNGTGYLFPISVTPSITNLMNGEFPVIDANFSNGTHESTPSQPWLQGSGTVTVSATYTSLPSDSAWVPAAATLITSGGSLTTTSSGVTGVSGTIDFPAPGDYQITMVGPIQNILSHAIVYQNYTWTVFVSPTNEVPGCGSCYSVPGLPVGPSDPHPGTIDTYEVAPGGATSIDPAVDYESVGYEVIANIYQTLVYYNGSSTSSFMPEIASCVPGTAQCSTLYGNDLIVNSVSGLPEYWTFVIDRNANFYDPAHRVAWGVYPSDVMASLGRTASFADLPFFAAQPGWIQTQSYVNNGQGEFDGGMHFPYNTTPRGILSGLLVNDSTYCPSIAITQEHGCLTVNAWGGGVDWPYLLQLLADPDGGAIEPCGWFGAQGAGLPGFTTTAANGDGPCALPGPANGGTTNSAAWRNYLDNTTSIYAWDAFENNSFNSPNVFAQTRFAGVGSGPYYLVSINKGVGYVLQANPAYGQPNCAGIYWCEPPAGLYAHTVNVFWQPTDQVGIQEYLDGQADFATIAASDTQTLLNLVADGKIDIETIPMIGIFFDTINMAVNLSTISGYYTGPLNIPSTLGGGHWSDFFSYVGLRQFLVNSFPYEQDIRQVLSVDGIPFGLNYGGAIPHFMDDYYAYNVTWPDGQPNFNVSQVGGAAWWWAQVNNASSPYYDPNLIGCTVATPCVFPVEGQSADTLQNGQYPIWGPYITALSGGRLVIQEVDLAFQPIPCEFFCPPGPYQNPLTFNVLGWLPDYPDPTDYTVPLYAPDATYTAPDSVNEVLTQDESPSCPDQSTTWASLAGWANMGGVPQDCQGWAYAVLNWGDALAGYLPIGAERTLYYNEVSHIANELALYLYQFQQQGVGSYAPWINPGSLDQNVCLAGDILWFEVQTNGLLD